MFLAIDAVPPQANSTQRTTLELDRVFGETDAQLEPFFFNGLGRCFITQSIATFSLLKCPRRVANGSILVSQKLSEPLCSEFSSLFYYRRQILNSGGGFNYFQTGVVCSVRNGPLVPEMELGNAFPNSLQGLLTPSPGPCTDVFQTVMVAFYVSSPSPCTILCRIAARFSF